MLQRNGRNAPGEKLLRKQENIRMPQRSNLKFEPRKYPVKEKAAARQVHLMIITML